MFKQQHVSVIIPALDEEHAIVHVVRELKQLTDDSGQLLIDDILVCDNGSSDATASVALAAGARVVTESRRGYGSACLAAMRCIDQTDIVLFIDGDYSCVTVQAKKLIELVSEETPFQLAIGSRTLGRAEFGSLTPPQRCGNWLAAKLIGLLWRQTVTDLGPFRAIRYASLQRLAMVDRAFGWTVEMQIKAIQQGMHIIEVPVDSRRRIGQSKISGTLTGVIGAGCGIMGKIGQLWWQQRRNEIHSHKIDQKTIEQ